MHSTPTYISTHARFTPLTPAIIRLEYDPNASFEDRPTLAFPNRQTTTAPPTVTLRDHAGNTITQQQFNTTGGTLDTDDLTLTYDPTIDDGRFTERSLSITLKHPPHTTWTPASKPTNNLGGTVRTLDHVSGATPLPPGLVSRDGWSLHDDSHMPVLVTPGKAQPSWHDQPWATARNAHPNAADLYFFGHAHNYTRALKEFTEVSGPIPLPPRQTLGVWWSRYWQYSDNDLKNIVTDFERFDIALDVLVIDMDWHLTGWTGYTWNNNLFPDPAGFLDWCEHKQLLVTLNLHPADGVGKHEAAFNTMRAAVGGGATMYRVPFDCTDPVYISAYFEHLHHPLQRQGVDFWWIDWQQGSQSPVENLDPLQWLNHLHWRDMELDTQRHATPQHADQAQTRHRRPIVFSRWGGLGGHRYPIGFSGDTFNDWPSLAFQPRFTATASNVCFAHWSHDIGGHQPGPVEPELYTRWIQFGILSPIIRTHAGKNPAAERRIWTFPNPYRDAMRDALHFRYQLIPYIDAANREASDTGVGLCRPMYYEHPDIEHAYHADEQYMFGPDLLAAPAVSPADPISNRTPVRVWLPPGTWTEWFTGRIHTVTNPEGEHRTVAAPLDEIPLFARSGAVIPTTPTANRVYLGHIPHLQLNIFPGSDGSTTVYEDDGFSDGYQHDEFTRTRVEHDSAEPDNRTITIHPATGWFPGFPDRRDTDIVLRESPDAADVTLNGEPLPRIDPPRDGRSQVAGHWYDDSRRALVIALPDRRTDSVTTVAVRTEPGRARPPAHQKHTPAHAEQRKTTESGGSAHSFCTTHGVVTRLIAEPGTNKTLRARFEVHNCPHDPDNANPIRVSAALDPLTAYHDHAHSGTPKIPDAVVDPDSSAIHQFTLAPTCQVPGSDQLTLHATVTVRTPDGDETHTLTQSTPLTPSINRWRALGPAPLASLNNPHHLGPEDDLENTLRRATNKPTPWRTLDRPTNIAPNKAFSARIADAPDHGNDTMIAFARTTLEVNDDTKAHLNVRTAAATTMLHNGREIYRDTAQSDRELTVAVNLSSGPNELFFRLIRAGGPIDITATVESPTGDVIPTVRCTEGD